MLKILTFIIAIGFFFSFNRINQASATEKKFVIYMILFNGKGNCERGFSNYLRSRNIDVEYIIKDCNGDLTNCPIENYIKEIRDIKPNLVYTWGTPITVAIAGTGKSIDPQKHITDIPVIALPIGNPVGNGFTPQIGSYTGRNLMGVSQMPSIKEQIKAIRLYGPIKKLGAIYTPYEPNIVTFVEDLAKIAKEEKFEFIAKPVPLLEDKKMDTTAIGPLIRELAQEKVDFLYIGPDTAILEFSEMIRKQSQKYKIPTFASSELTAEKINPVFGFFSRFYHVGQLAGYKAEQLFLNKLPKEQIFTFETLKYMSYTINPKMGIEIGLSPPVTLFKFAQITE